MQIGAAQPGSANAHNDIPGACYLWLRYFLYFGKFMILVNSHCFHMYSSMFSSSSPSKREPGNPHSRKKSPVARQSATLVSLVARINDLLRLLAETRERIHEWNALGRNLCDAFVDVAERVTTPA